MKKEWMFLLSIALLASCILICATDDFNANGTEREETVTVEFGTFLDTGKLPSIYLKKVGEEGEGSEIDFSEWNEVGNSHQTSVDVKISGEVKNAEFMIYEKVEENNNASINTVYCNVVEVGEKNKLMFWITDWKLKESKLVDGPGNEIAIGSEDYAVTVELGTSGTTTLKGKIALNKKFTPLDSKNLYSINDIKISSGAPNLSADVAVNGINITDGARNWTLNANAHIWNLTFTAKSKTIKAVEIIIDSKSVEMDLGGTSGLTLNGSVSDFYISNQSESVSLNTSKNFKINAEIKNLYVGDEGILRESSRIFANKATNTILTESVKRVDFSSNMLTTENLTISGDVYIGSSMNIKAKLVVNGRIVGIAERANIYALVYDGEFTLFGDSFGCLNIPATSIVLKDSVSKFNIDFGDNLIKFLKSIKFEGKTLVESVKRYKSSEIDLILPDEYENWSDEYLSWIEKSGLFSKIESHDTYELSITDKRPTILTKIEPTFSVSNLSAFFVAEDIGGIGDGVFRDRSDLTEITIPDRIRSIGNSAFEGTGLKTVIIDSSSVSWGEGVFKDCKDLEKVTGLNSLSKQMFSGCEQLKSVSMASGISLSKIPERSFQNCKSLMSISVADACEVGPYAFQNCSSLSTVSGAISSSLGDYAFEGCSSLSSIGTSGLTSIGTASLSGTDITSFDLSGAGSVGVSAFMNCGKLSGITNYGSDEFPNDVFNGCISLSEVGFTVGKSYATVTEFGSNWSYGTNIKINGDLNLNKVGTNALSGQTIANVTLADGASIEDGSFGGSNITTLTIEGRLTIEKTSGYGSKQPAPFAGATITEVVYAGDNVDNYLFSDSKIKKITFVRDVMIGNSSFSGCTELKKVDFGERTENGTSVKYKIVSIGSKAFQNCTSLEQDMTLSLAKTGNRIYVPSEAFNGSGITGINIVSDGSIVEIQNGAFGACKNLKSVNWESVCKIGMNAFVGCSSLEGEIDLSKVESIGSNAFVGCSGISKLNVSKTCEIGTNICEPDKISLTKKYDIMNDKNETIATLFVYEADCTILLKCVISSSSPIDIDLTEYKINRIGKEVFKEQTKLKSIIFGSSISEICESAFEGCTNLTSVAGGAQRLELQTSAFRGCINLKDIRLGSETVNSIGYVSKLGSNAFSNCTSIETLALPQLSEYGQYAFSGCTKLKFTETGEVTLMGTGNNSKLGAFAFSGTAVKAVTLSNIALNNSAFKDCISLNSVTFEGGVTIGPSVFEGCLALKFIEGLDGISSIGDKGFSNSGISNLVFDSNITIGQNAFEGCFQLKAVEFKKSANLGNSSFASCEMLQGVSFNGSASTIGDYAFRNCIMLGWNDDVTTSYGLTLTGVTRIGARAFEGCSSLSTVTLPASLTDLSVDAFAGCTHFVEAWATSLSPGFTIDGDMILANGGTEIVLIRPDVENITIPASVSSLRGYTNNTPDSEKSTLFSSLSMLKSISVVQGNTVFKSIDGALALMDGTIIAVPCNSAVDGVVTISKCTAVAPYSFMNVNATDVVLKSVESIGNNAFYGCPSLRNLTVSGTDVEFSLDAFYSDQSYEIETLCISECDSVKISGASYFLKNLIVDSEKTADLYGMVFQPGSKIKTVEVKSDKILWNGSSLEQADPDIITLISNSSEITNGIYKGDHATKLHFGLKGQSISGMLSDAVDCYVMEGLEVQGVTKRFYYDSTYGVVYGVDGSSVYVLSDLEDIKANLSGNLLTITTADGHTPGDIKVLMNNRELSADTSGKYTVSGTGIIVLVVTELDDSELWHTVSFDTGCSVSVPKIRISDGHSILNSLMPEPERAGFEFGGWYTDKDLNNPYSHDHTGQIMKDITLYAKWVLKSEKYLDVDDSAGSFFSVSGSVEIEFTSGEFKGEVTLVFRPSSGFSFLGFKVEGLKTGQYTVDKDRISIKEMDDGYACITPLLLYVSSSTDLEYVVDRDTPKQSDDLVLAWAFDGGNVKQTGMVWSGMPSVPLIVDDRVYIQANDRIYCLDAETGAVLYETDDSNKSKATSDFYHYLGYGGGYILDYTSGNVYDTDLKVVCKLPSGIYYAVWFDGAFYGIANDGKSSTGAVWKMHPNTKDSNSVMTNQFTETTSDIMQRLYGTTSHAVVVEETKTMYYISVNGNAISINAVSLVDGSSSTKHLGGLTGFYLDDGWLTYDNGHLYITAYTKGLFGSSTVTGNARICWMDVSGLTIGDLKTVEMDSGQTSLTSAFVIQNGRGYVNVAESTSKGYFRVYDLKEDGTPVFVKQVNSAASHGSLVASTYNYDPVTKSGEVYIYLLNYSSNQFLYIFKDVCEDGTWTLSDTVVKKPIEPGFGSQAVRVGTEGQLIFYNDSGKVYCYGTPEFASRFGFLVDNGDTADIRIGDGVETDAEKALEKAVADAFGVRKADVNLTNGTVVVAGKTYYMYYINSDGQAVSIKDLKDSELSKVKTFYLTDEQSASNIDSDKVWYSSDAKDKDAYVLKSLTPNLRSYQPAILERFSVSWGYGDTWSKIYGDDGKLVTIICKENKDSSGKITGYMIGEVKTISKDGFILKGFTDGTKLYTDGDIYQISGRVVLNAVWVKADMGITSMDVILDGTSVEDRDALTLVVGEHSISVSILPTMENGYTILSSNTNILSVDASGKITAIKPGKVTLTVTAMSGSEDKKISVEITVVDPTSTKIVDMVDSSVSLDVGATKDLSGVKTDLGKSVRWSSSNPSVAAVSNGKLVALAEGTAVMTATAEDNDSVTATFIVTVSKAVKPIQSVDLDKSVYTLKIKGTVTLKATVTPSDADDVGRLIWESSKPSVASVSSGGVVTAISAGSTVITVSTADGRYSDTCVITVEGTVTSVSLDQDTLRLEAGKSATLKATTAPDESTKFTWTSSDSKVASVSGGKVTAIAPGTATITVKCGDLTATCTVTVYKNSDVKTEVDTDKETGNTTTKTEETTTSGDSTVITKTEETKDKDDKSLGTDIKVDAESGNGNVKTEATVKKDSDGNVTESTMTTTIAAEVKSSNGKQTISISQDDLLAAVDQIEAVRNATGQDLEPVITIDVSSKGSASASSATIPSDALEKMSRNGDAQLQLKTSAGTVEITSDVMSKLSENGEDVKLGIKKVTESEISQETKAKIGDAHMFELSATTGSTEHHQLGGKVIVSLPYVLDGGRSSKDVRVYHMDDSGNLVQMTCAYDAETGMVSFVTDHFSYFVVSDKALIDEPGMSVSSDDGIAGLLTIVIALLVVLIAMIAVAFVLYIRSNHAHI